MFLLRLKRCLVVASSVLVTLSSLALSTACGQEEEQVYAPTEVVQPTASHPTTAPASQVLMVQDTILSMGFESFLNPLNFDPNDSPWDSTGPGVSGDHAWGGQSGRFTYHFDLPPRIVESGTLEVSARLSSEYPGFAPDNQFSDVTLVVNGREYETHRVIPDDGRGRYYVWKVEARDMGIGRNTLAFVVKADAAYANGIAIYRTPSSAGQQPGSIRISLWALSKGSSISNRGSSSSGASGGSGPPAATPSTYGVGVKDVDSELLTEEERRNNIVTEERAEELQRQQEERDRRRDREAADRERREQWEERRAREAEKARKDVQEFERAAEQFSRDADRAVQDAGKAADDLIKGLLGN